MCDKCRWVKSGKDYNIFLKSRIPGTGDEYKYQDEPPKHCPWCGERIEKPNAEEAQEEKEERIEDLLEIFREAEEAYYKTQSYQVEWYRFLAGVLYKLGYQRDKGDRK